MTDYCFAVPILPGGADLLKKFVEDNYVDGIDHDAVLRAAGISHEQIWIQRMAHGSGDFAIVRMETKDPSHSFKVLSTSTNQWAVKFREYMKKAHGIDVTQRPPPLNEMVEDWKGK
jgi:hypothetical protein